MEEKDLVAALRKLTNKSNKVTSYFRHGNKVPDRYLSDLYEAQLLAEETLRNFKEGEAHEDINDFIIPFPPELR